MDMVIILLMAITMQAAQVHLSQFYNEALTSNSCASLSKYRSLAPNAMIAFQKLRDQYEATCSTPKCKGRSFTTTAELKELKVSERLILVKKEFEVFTNSLQNNRRWDTTNTQMAVETLMQISTDLKACVNSTAIKSYSRNLRRHLRKLKLYEKPSECRKAKMFSSLLELVNEHLKCVAKLKLCTK
ncbi:interferon lambda-3-like [Protopterus annectens]|uniref:interferon lambda-3-like n=1 Tax=Protopterus annectens TaxID=7888 RepID=UPI001CF95B8F|nr:interferon lambda-3-like [Protopterus annectens]